MLASLFACVFIASTGGVFASDEAAATTDAIRAPEGEVDAFWDGFKWAELNAAEQAALGALGWTDNSWDNDVDVPASEDKKWDELSDDEKAAAGSLGYDEAAWDATAPEKTE